MFHKLRLKKSATHSLSFNQKRKFLCNWHHWTYDFLKANLTSWGSSQVCHAWNWNNRAVKTSTTGSFKTWWISSQLHDQWLILETGGILWDEATLLRTSEVRTKFECFCENLKSDGNRNASCLTGEEGVIHFVNKNFSPKFVESSDSHRKCGCSCNRLEELQESRTKSKHQRA